MIKWGDPSQPLHWSIGSVPKKRPQVLRFAASAWTHNKTSFFLNRFACFSFMLLGPSFPPLFFNAYERLRWVETNQKKRHCDPPPILSVGVKTGSQPKNHRLQSPLQGSVWSSSVLVAIDDFRQWLCKDKQPFDVFKGVSGFGGPWVKVNHCFFF